MSMRQDWRRENWADNQEAARQTSRIVNRIHAASKIPADHIEKEEATGHYRVRSSKGDCRYRVVPGISCTCPDFEARAEPCKHMIRTGSSVIPAKPADAVREAVAKLGASAEVVDQAGSTVVAKNAAGELRAFGIPEPPSRGRIGGIEI